MYQYAVCYVFLFDMVRVSVPSEFRIAMDHTFLALVDILAIELCGLRVN
jgi:hypothetical protein